MNLFRTPALLVVSCLVFLAFSVSLLPAQLLTRLDSIEVLENAVVLKNPFAGGFNNPQFSEIDLNGDNIMDLIVFDRNGETLLPFLNGGTAGTIDYTYAPQYTASFPTGFKDFMITADYNCDGKMDLFTASNNGMDVWENVTNGGALTFQLAIDTIKTDYGNGSTLLFVPDTDVPALKDIDGDGDLDMLAFDPIGTFVEWHKNMYQENNGSCAGLDFVVADRCWGKFQENALSQDVSLGISCRTAVGNTATDLNSGGVHAGSTLALFDEDADGDYEMVLGDLLFDGLTYLRNGGTPNAAVIDSASPLFPQYDTPVRVHVFPAGFFLDVDNDNKEDMLVAPNGLSVSINYESIWFYKNIASGPGVQLNRQSTVFLQNEMVDVGLGAYPVLFDYNADGLSDLLIGNFTQKLTNTTVNSGLALYENIGTATDPRFELVTRDYGNFTALFNPQVFGMTPTVGDLDGDGDVDLIVGDADGKLNYFENTAGSGQTAIFSSVVANYKSIDVGQFSSPCLVDMNRDGLLDLVIGETGGNLNYFENIGTASQPDFASTPNDDTWGGVDVEPVCCTGFSIPFVFENPASGKYDLLVGSEKGDIFYYRNIEDSLGTNFALNTGTFAGLREGGRTAITGGDINADGVADWIVGNVRGGIAIFSGESPLTSSAQPVRPVAEVQLYPNPSRGELNLDYKVKAGEKFSIMITDLNGRVMREEVGRGATGTISVDGQAWGQGLYFVALRVNGQFAGVKKWVKNQ
ncbi:MAG: FG-GAP-like repeat-containing protein [Bacteroidota bacterium]